MNEPKTYTVVPLAEEHLREVARLERLTFSEPWSEDALRRLLGPDATGAVALTKEGLTAAYAGMWLSPFEGAITEVAVFPQYRRTGAGSALLAYLIREAEKRGLEQISLEVRASNLAAIGLYEKSGFSTAGVRKRFYRDPPEDALVMVRPIGPTEETTNEEG